VTQALVVFGEVAPLSGEAAAIAHLGISQEALDEVIELAKRKLEELSFDRPDA
jgi:hypothetical protein